MVMLGDSLLTLSTDCVLRVFTVTAAGMAWPDLAWNDCPYAGAFLFKTVSFLCFCLSHGHSMILLAIDLLMEIQFGPDSTPTSILHPDTYINKVLVATREGLMQLWNIRTKWRRLSFWMQCFIKPLHTHTHATFRKLLYTFPAFASPITTMCQSPVVDVVAVGLLNGSIVLYNIKTDEKLFEFSQDGKVTHISFRTGNYISYLASFWKLPSTLTMPAYTLFIFYFLVSLFFIFTIISLPPSPPFTL